MATMHWLIDETGDIWQAQSELLRARLGFAPRSAEERASFLVTNLGYIAVDCLRHGLAVRWRPTSVSRETFAAAALLIGEQPEQRVVVSTLDKEWSNRLLPSVEQAVDALLAEFGTARCDEGSHFEARQRAPSTLPPSSLIRRTLAAARDAEFRFEPEGLWSMLEATVSGRYLLLDPDHEQRRLRIMALGRGYATLSQRWMKSAPGTDFEDQPDAGYAREAAQAYWAAIGKGAPAIEDVNASVWWQSRGRTALRYTRLVLPLDVAGKRRILCTSELSGKGRDE